MRLSLVALVALVAVCAVATAEAVTYPDRFVTVPAAGRSVKTMPFAVYWCPPATTCVIAETTGYISGYQEVRVKILSLRARGIGLKRLVAGVPRFHEFDVSLCVVNYLDGGAQRKLRLRWNAGRVWTGAARLASLTVEYGRLAELVRSQAATPAQTARFREVRTAVRSLQLAEEQSRPYVVDWYSRGIPILRRDAC